MDRLKRQAALFMYRMPADDNVLETCIASLRRHNNSVRIVLITDGITPVLTSRLKKLYGVEILMVESMRGERMRRKITETSQWILDRIKIVDEVAVFDADLYFTGDPFNAFREYDFDIGVTKRHYNHFFHLNLGVIYYRIEQTSRRKSMRQFLDWISHAVTPPEWKPLQDWMRKYEHARWHGDWWVDQDLFCILWDDRNEMMTDGFCLDMVDTGIKYNYITKRLSEKGRAKMIEEFKRGGAVTYHLRGRLKDLIYEGVFPDVITCHPRLNPNWGSHG